MEIKDMTAVQLSAAIKEGIRREVTPDSFFDCGRMKDHRIGRCGSVPCGSQSV